MTDIQNAIATDADLDAWERSLDGAPDSGLSPYVRAGEIRKLLGLIAALRAENERLKAEIADHAEWAKRVADPTNPEHVPVVRAIRDLEAENAALRAELDAAERERGTAHDAAVREAGKG